MAATILRSGKIIRPAARMDAEPGESFTRWKDTPFIPHPSVNTPPTHPVPRMIQSVVVLGGGSAGLIAALTLKRRLPQLKVRVVRSPEIGVIGVGEGTTAGFPKHFFAYLGFNPRKFYQEAEPTFKLGIRFEWGPRPAFFYTFTTELDASIPELSRAPGFYIDDETQWQGLASACLAHGKAFPRDPRGAPDLRYNHAFHIENVKLVGWLDSTARSIGVEITDGTMQHAESGDGGIAALHLESGERVEADLFVDASGFRRELVGKALQEPRVSYDGTLFCDRAVIAGWPRTTEPLQAYTVAETMDAGWCWQIEHEHWINRGYVYSSRFIDDETALAEFRAKNPKLANEPRTVRFSSGRLARPWVGNVVAVGNASGFVEPLEASALQVICSQTRTLADALMDSQCAPTPTLITLYNEVNNDSWDDIRDFLAVHYAFNRRLDTPFWKTCRAETDLAGAARLVEFYRENGPSLLGKAQLVRPTNSFGMDGFLTLLVGQMVPHAKAAGISPAEQKVWRDRHAALAQEAHAWVYGRTNAPEDSQSWVELGIKIAIRGRPMVSSCAFVRR